MPKAKAAKSEFLILEVGETRGTGATYVLRGVATSEAKAKEELQKLAVGSAARLAIVQTRGVFVREPVVTVKAVGQSIVPEQS